MTLKRSCATSLSCGCEQSTKVNFASPEMIGVELPFNRYYMDENDAPAADAAYREDAKEVEACVTVRILGGRGVIEELYVGGKPIREFLRTQAE